MNNSLSKLEAINRALVGFDSVFDNLERRYSSSSAVNYPPYNIAKIGENRYQIDIAVTGFNKEEIKLTVESNELVVRGERNREGEASIEYFHRGLALRDFERVFTLAEHMIVVNAVISNGILHIEIEREVPESAKLKVIDIEELK